MKNKIYIKIIAFATALTSFCTAMDEKISSKKYREILIHMNGEKLTNEILNTIDIYEIHMPELKQGNNLFLLLMAKMTLCPLVLGIKYFAELILLLTTTIACFTASSETT